jgi:hypothetical protein
VQISTPSITATTNHHQNLLQTHIAGLATQAELLAIVQSDVGNLTEYGIFYC